MAVREIVLFPHPVLKTVCSEIDPGSEQARRIARDLEETLDAGPGVGLAAPQIGEPYRVILVDAGRNPKRAGQGRFVLFNPKIVAQTGRQKMREGCLSIPGYTGNVIRALEVEVEGVTMDGETLRITAREYEAVVFQHEIDHLHGVLFLDRIADLRTDLIRRAPKPDPRRPIDPG